MTRLRVVGFASGSPMSLAALSCIAQDHQLLAIVMPTGRPGLRRLLRPWLARVRGPFARFGVPVLDFAACDQPIARLHPDLIVVASFPKKLSSTTMAQARLGALNVHTSLLPRHRGSNPIFWTYWHDDALSGVSIHWMDEHFDHGDIVAQQPHPLTRGKASRTLYAELSDTAVRLLGQVLGQVSGGSATRTPQAEGQSALAPSSDIGHAVIPFAEWPAERVWHVLAGLGDQWSGLVSDSAGGRIAHGRAIGFHLDQQTTPGTIEHHGEEIVLHCRDGVVFVARTRQASGSATG